MTQQPAPTDSLRSTRTRIIHLVRCKTWGGGERYALDLSENFIKGGFPVSAICHGLPENIQRFSKVGAETYKLSLGGVFDLISPFKILKIIKEYEEDIILHVHNFKDAELAVKVKSLFHHSEERTERSLKIVCTRHLVRPAKTSLRWKWIYDGIDKLIFVSNFAKGEFLATRPPIDEKKIEVVYNAINVPRQYSIPPETNSQFPMIILFTGRLSPEKGLEDLIEACGMLKDLEKEWILRIVGTGPNGYLSELKELAEEVGIGERIEWVGFKENVYIEIRKADVCVAPSIAKESFGLNLLEYMSQGRPIIATNNGAQPEIITTNVDGILIPPSNPRILSFALTKILHGPLRSIHLGRKAYTTYKEKFPFLRFYMNVKEIYDSVFDKSEK